MSVSLKNQGKWLSLVILWCCLAGMAVTAEGLEKPNTGSSLLGVGDITNVTSLIAKLKNDANPSTKPVSQFIWGEFDSAAKQSLSDTSLSLSQHEILLIEELNKILRGKSLYDQARFNGVHFRPETTKLRSTQNLNGEYLILFSRLALEDAYPQEISRNNISYLGSGLADNTEGLYRHSVVFREGQNNFVEIDWQDHASELQFFHKFNNFLVALGKVGTSSESVSIVNLTDKSLSDFILCRDPVNSFDGRYIAYLQFVPRHTMLSEGNISDIVLVYDLAAETNVIPRIAQDEGWVSLAANKGSIIYPQDFRANRVFPLSPKKDNTETVKASAWASDNRKLFILTNKESKLKIVSIDMGQKGGKSLAQHAIDLHDVLKHSDQAAINSLNIKGFEISKENTMTIILSPSQNVVKERVVVKLGRD